MNETICDHTSVGMIATKDEKILLIERKKPPFGFAPPAGHVDGDESYEVAAEREMKEEVGLAVSGMRLIYEGRRENQCRREDGDWHYWKVYQVDVEGELKPGKDEVKRHGWFSRGQIQLLLDKTNEYMAGKVSEKEWSEDPGIEPVWAEMLQELEILDK